MRLRSFLIVLFCAVAGVSEISSAQMTAQASAAATVLQPVSLVKTVDLNFGNAAVSLAAGGAIVMSPSGTRSTTGVGVTLPATVGTISAANFIVSGAPGFSIVITLPSSAVVYGPGSTNMVVNNFTSTPSGTSTLGTGGTCSISVGATLNINAAQASGSYVSSSALPVTVNYN